ncbi:hypothetical protein OCH239_05290 [Roseivivax halodurans JCM 10272]|uniref:Uncharacterized protein n=1 Tax=Roseivivax halodurans JCM 10272 TaxID=1449350 RepID=X7EDV6_9RHOB|nr:hypothetical protein [Roseivivax halodurans]ETX14055.1 hypothetical protein OCH239_05290 [Roseivivax halodurans JCM 10272]
MSFETDLRTGGERLEALAAEKLGRTRGSLARRAARAGRDLPRGVRRDLAIVAEALHLSDHPRLRCRIDEPGTRAALTRSEAHLAGIDAADRRWGRILGLLTVIAFNLLVVATGLLILLRWRGLV